MSSQNLTATILSLTRLLTHKIKGTHPSSFPSTPLPNTAIRNDFQFINNHESFAELGDDDFKAAYDKLGCVVSAWSDQVDCSMKERAELARAMQNLFKAQGFKQRADGEWDAPKVGIEKS
ncbi:MAG: hypothetical protein HETSPECPRED_000841 [Heterodermia speciosa]|uniref:Uncharacterized protein n=1 Tax=Heterodermia speciosa TaxID=116794 RepID=A0A8H3IBD8_9LECA|nr:MAG: hypothetical protein HETSPECPRED_000841 [Heterodermia speciosa]